MRQVRAVIIQYVMGYNNTQPVAYWKKMPFKRLLCNTGASDRLYLERLLVLAIERDRQVARDNRKKEAVAN